MIAHISHAVSVITVDAQCMLYSTLTGALIRLSAAVSVSTVGGSVKGSGASKLIGASFSGSFRSLIRPVQPSQCAHESIQYTLMHSKK
jgi:hypothetical protein